MLWLGGGVHSNSGELKLLGNSAPIVGSLRHGPPLGRLVAAPKAAPRPGTCAGATPPAPTGAVGRSLYGPRNTAVSGAMSTESAFSPLSAPLLQASQPRDNTPTAVVAVRSSLSR